MTSLKIVTFYFKVLAIAQIAFHHFHDGVRQSHAHKGVSHLGLSMYLAQLEETFRYRRRILKQTTKNEKKSRIYAALLTVIKQ